MEGRKDVCTSVRARNCFERRAECRRVYLECIQTDSAKLLSTVDRSKTLRIILHLDPEKLMLQREQFIKSCIVDPQIFNTGQLNYGFEPTKSQKFKSYEERASSGANLKRKLAG